MNRFWLALVCCLFAYPAQAELGYTAFALDMYGTGKLAEHPKDAQAFASVTLDFSVVQERFNKAVDLLKSQSTVDPTMIAAIGYCMGGSIVLNMARSGADLNGVVSFHWSLGNRIDAKPGTVKAKIRVCNGAADPFVKPEHLAAFESALKATGADFEIKNYAGVKHSFTNPDADVYGPKFQLPLAYDKAADEDSWAGMQGFFKEIFQARATAGLEPYRVRAGSSLPPTAASIASDMISTPRSISASDTVKGGAMRKTPPMPGSLTIFMLSPRDIASSMMRAPSSNPGAFVSRSVTISSPSRRPRPRTSPTHAYPCLRDSSPFRSRSPRITAFSTSPSRSTTSRTVTPTAAGSGSDT